MLEPEVIEPAQTHCATPIFFVAKMGCPLQFSFDYRKLNSVTVRDPYPIQRTKKRIISLVLVTIFLKLDVNSGYWQVNVAKGNCARPR